MFVATDNRPNNGSHTMFRHGQELQLKNFSRNESRRLAVRWVLWNIALHLIVRPWFTPRRARTLVLKMFGAKVGKRCAIRENTYIHMPWNLEMGDDVWIGRGVSIFNHATVSIGNDVCLSQSATICASGHALEPGFAYRHRPISIGSNVWLGIACLVLPGSEIQDRSVVKGGAVIRPEVAKVQPTDTPPLR